MNNQQVIDIAINAINEEIRSRPLTEVAVQARLAAIAALRATQAAPHNEAPADPDTHIVFASVCCAARIYRCNTLVDGLPSKPLISSGEANCRTCQAPLTRETGPATRGVVVKVHGKVVSTHESVADAQAARNALLLQMIHDEDYS